MAFWIASSRSPPPPRRPSRRWASGGDLAAVNFNDDATVLEREDNPPRLTPPTLPPIPRLGPQAFLPVASLVRIQGIGGVPRGLNHERI